MSDEIFMNGDDSKLTFCSDPKPENLDRFIQYDQHRHVFVEAVSGKLVHRSCHVRYTDINRLIWYTFCMQLISGIMT